MELLKNFVPLTYESPLDNIVLFKALFVLASEDYDKELQIYLKSLDEEVSLEEYEAISKFREAYHFTPIRQVKLNPEGRKARPFKNPYYLPPEYFEKQLALSPNGIKAHSSAVNKLVDIGMERAQTSSQIKKYRGLSKTIYMDEQYLTAFTLEEAQALFLMDYQNKLEHGGRGRVDIRINVLEPTEDLVKSFKVFLKDMRELYLSNVMKTDKRFNTPDFVKWELYLTAYLLRVKQIKPSLLNNKWPKKSLNRQEAAKLLFKGSEYDHVQELDRYVRKAKTLIKKALNNEGAFGFDLNLSRLPL